ncbi:acyl-CoA thioesterase [Candidatus Gracilibacteria bacterium]|nr:acyl-CoA thioesterase [Candidatus Gracilibacteria bacterium]
MTELSPLLAEFPFVYRAEVRFRDLDALGHVNNAVYATYFESARLNYYQALTGLPLARLNIILAEITITYHAPAHFGDTLDIGARVASIGTKSFVMEYLAVAQRDHTALKIATCRSVLVAYDYQTGKSVPVSEELRRAVEVGDRGQGEVGSIHHTSFGKVVLVCRRVLAATPPTHDDKPSSFIRT